MRYTTGTSYTLFVLVGSDECLQHMDQPYTEKTAYAYKRKMMRFDRAFLNVRSEEEHKK